MQGPAEYRHRDVLWCEAAAQRRPVSQRQSKTMYRKRKAAHRAGKVQFGGVKEGRSSELFRKGYVLRSRAAVRFCHTE